MDRLVLRVMMGAAFLMFLFLLGMALSSCGQPLSEIGTSISVPQLLTDVPITPIPPDMVTPIDSLKPSTRLPDDALGTFDTNKFSSLDIGGRYYWLDSCGSTHCRIVLWPDKTAVWVERAVIGDFPSTTTLSVVDMFATANTHNTEVAAERTAEAAIIYATAGIKP